MAEAKLILHFVLYLFYSIVAIKLGLWRMQYEFGFLGRLPIRPKRPERLFFGFFPDAPTSMRIVQLRQRFLHEKDFGGNLIQADRLHVSLHHVGDYKRLKTKFIYAASEAAKAISMPPFEMTFRFIQSFEGAPSVRGKPRGRPLVLMGGGDTVFDLHKNLGRAMGRLGLKARDDFTPHITLLYGPESVPLQPIEPIRLAVNAFDLIHSHLWLSHYDIKGRWELRD